MEYETLLLASGEELGDGAELERRGDPCMPYSVQVLSTPTSDCYLQNIMQRAGCKNQRQHITHIKISSAGVEGFNDWR